MLDMQSKHEKVMNQLDIILKYVEKYSLPREYSGGPRK